MALQESEQVELKLCVVEDIKKDILAFANSFGGILYVGVSDDGHIVGVENADHAIQQIANMVRDTIKPDITLFIRYDTKVEQGKDMVAIEIQRGTMRPYYLRQKGLRPEGVFVRQGTSSVPATEASIRRMIKETDGESLEALRSLEQNLTFHAATEMFETRNLAFGPSQMRTLGMLNGDGIYTNLGLLLSDQCNQTVKVAVFEGTDQTIFRDRKEFSGSLFKQLNDVYDYIEARNQVRSTFDKLQRIDTHDYPEVAIRETLLNSLVHRDYSFGDSTLISMYRDRIEFVSLGGLITGVSLDDVLLGLSVCRNPNLANVFYRLGLIEAYGTGLKKIIGSYEKSSIKPVIETTANAFKIQLPNLNESPSTAPLGDRVSEEQLVLEYLKKNNSITRKEAEDILGLKQSSATRRLNNMIQKKKIVQRGQGKNTNYTLP